MFIFECTSGQFAHTSYTFSPGISWYCDQNLGKSSAQGLVETTNYTATPPLTHFQFPARYTFSATDLHMWCLKRRTVKSYLECFYHSLSSQTPASHPPTAHAPPRWCCEWPRHPSRRQHQSRWGSICSAWTHNMVWITTFTPCSFSHISNFYWLYGTLINITMHTSNLPHYASTHARENKALVDHRLHTASIPHCLIFFRKLTEDNLYYNYYNFVKND